MEDSKEVGVKRSLWQKIIIFFQKTYNRNNNKGWILTVIFVLLIV